MSQKPVEHTHAMKMEVDDELVDDDTMEAVAPKEEAGDDTMTTSGGSRSDGESRMECGDFEENAPAAKKNDRAKDEHASETLPSGTVTQQDSTAGTSLGQSRNDLPEYVQFFHDMERDRRRYAEIRRWYAQAVAAGACGFAKSRVPPDTSKGSDHEDMPGCSEQQPSTSVAGTSRPNPVPEQSTRDASAAAQSPDIPSEPGSSLASDVFGSIASSDVFGSTDDQDESTSQPLPDVQVHEPTPPPGVGDPGYHEYMINKIQRRNQNQRDLQIFMHRRRGNLDSYPSFQGVRDRMPDFMKNSLLPDLDAVPSQQLVVQPETPVLRQSRRVSHPSRSPSPRRKKTARHKSESSGSDDSSAKQPPFKKSHYF